MRIKDIITYKYHETISSAEHKYAFLVFLTDFQKEEFINSSCMYTLFMFVHV